MKKFIALIPARGGSKRFPGKNIHLLNHKPLISYSIEYAKRYKEILRVFVSTDDPCIKDISLKFGAEVLDRPTVLAGDEVPTSAVLQQVSETLLSNDYFFDYLVLLQPTNPLRPPEMLGKAIKLMETGKYDSLMSVSSCNRKLGKIIDGKFCPWNYHYGQRSQDMEALYYEDGLFYISSKELLLQGKIIGENMHPMVTDHVFGEIDIDTKQDMLYAEYILKQYGHE